MKNYVWVIEMKDEHTEEWRPTSDAQLSKSDAHTKARGWRLANPEDKFRVVKYEAAS